MCTSAAASTSTRPRWSRSWPGWTESLSRPSSGCPTRGSARWARHSWSCVPVTTWPSRTCWPGAGNGWRTTRCRGPWSSASACPATRRASHSSGCSGRSRGDRSRPGPGVDLTAEQRALRDAVRALLAREQPRAPVSPDPGPRPASPGPAPYSPDPPSGYDRVLWQRLGEIGVPALGVPERYGGAGAGPVETHVVAEELGRRLTATPLLGSAVLAAQALLGSGDRAACERLLPAVADGTAIATLAWTGATGRWDPGEVACHA